MINPNPWRISIADIPEHEQDATWAYLSLLHLLQSYSNDFSAALKLYDFSSKNRDALIGIVTKPENTDKFEAAFREFKHFQSWCNIAQRDAAMTIYHFGESLDATIKGLAKCPTLDALVDRSLLNRAQPLFKKNFRKSTDARDSVAHSSEPLAQKGRHSISGSCDGDATHICDAEDLTIMNVATDNGLLMTWKGKLIHLKLTSEKLDQLCEVRDLVFAAFECANVELTKRRLAGLIE